MDIASLLGLIAGGVCLGVSIMLSAGSFGPYLDMPSVLIVVGGSFAALFISTPLDKFIKGLISAKFVFSNKKLDAGSLIKKINELAQKARKDGLLALEEVAQNTEDEFLKKGIMLIVDGTDPELVRDILETELSFIETRHEENQNFWATLAEMAPAWGMLGTLVGLIAMLGSLDDPSTIGPSMAVAFITTLYGSLLANFIGTPIANKLKIKNGEEMLFKQVMIEGILSIQAGENPRVIEEKLKAFLSPELRGIESQEKEN